MAGRIHLPTTSSKFRLKLSTPEPITCKSETDVRRLLNTRRKTDAALNPPPSYDQAISSKPRKSLIERLRRCHSEEKLEQLPEHVVQERKRAPRGIAPIDDFPSQEDATTDPQIRFNPNAGFEAFYDSCCFSVPAENWGNWPQYPTREMNPNAPATKIELTLSAKNLKDCDVFSKSDPLCVIFEAFHSADAGLKYGERGRTECVKNCLNPEWNTKIIIDYMFEERQRMKFEIYDIDSGSQALSHHDFLGRAECDLADIVASPFSTLTLPLKDLKQKGTITIHAEEVNEGQTESMRFIVHGRGLDKKDFFGKSDPFLNIYRPVGDGTRQLVHRTEVIKRTLNPEWKAFSISVRALCQGDKNRDFIIECFDYDNDGGSRHDLIGITHATVNKLASGDIKELELINEKKKAKKGKKYKNSGILRFELAKLEQEYTFLDFIHGGLELEFTVSVDFTASNGAVTVPSSLHFCNPHSSNEYQMAIKAVLEICQAYNKTKNFSAYGFGAQVPPSYAVSHLFPLNLNNSEVHGIEGVMQAYATSLRNTTLYGPTNFSPTINEAARKAAYYPPGGGKYQILLIITDGVISDMQQTKNAIIMASTLPLSVIIVGVGDADFDKMDELDSDDELLTANGRTAKRDIVQFVPFRKFFKRGGMVSPYEQERLQYLLAKEVLAEVPTQIVSYMKANNVIPRPPQQQQQQPDTMQMNHSGSPPYPTNGHQQNGNIYPSYAPANPPAYDEAMGPGVNMDQINVAFTNHVNVQASAPYF